MSNKPSGLSIVIPARNEEETIETVVTDCFNVITKIGLDYEIIVVDDGSTDKTRDIVNMLECRSIINEGPDHGKGVALRAGFAAVRYDTIIMLDADGSHRAEDIPILVQEFQKGYGLIVADRFVGGSDEYTFLRSFGNRFLTMVFSWLFGVQLNDALNGYKIFKSCVFDSFIYTAKDFSIEIELLANAKRLDKSIGQVRSHERKRSGGQAKSFAIKHGTSFLFRIIYERFRTAKFIDPK